MTASTSNVLRPLRLALSVALIEAGILPPFTKRGRGVARPLTWKVAMVTSPVLGNGTFAVGPRPAAEAGRAAASAAAQRQAGNARTARL
jgi:hypothetical protein